MTEHKELNLPRSLASFFNHSNENSTLPQTITDQVNKLNELESIVKTAIDAATQAEKRAERAEKIAAGRSIFSDKKKEAIEELQSAGIELASAVQLGARAQQTSFEFQKRLADISQSLFKLGVNNIAANRTVVRDLEMRLSGASKEELSDLARKEVISVIQQLKEQEDLLRKQEQITITLKDHDLKIKCALDETSELERRLDNQEARQHALDRKGDAMEHASALQQLDILALRQKVDTIEACLENLTVTLSLANSKTEQATASLRSTLRLRTTIFTTSVVAIFTIVYLLH